MDKSNTKQMKILGLIPARAGSKRVSNKNLKLLNGKPLISYTIFSALESKFINRIIVSTNSEEIASVAKKYGAEVPFLRPEEISGDNSTELEYYEHALLWLKDNESYVPDVIVNLYPTTPFRKTETIDSATQKFLDNFDYDSLRSVIKCTEHPYKMWQINNKVLVPFVKTDNDNAHTFSYHLLPEFYIQNASIYITKPETIYKLKSTVGKKVLPFIMNSTESLDINNPLDFEFAEYLIQNNKI